MPQNDVGIDFDLKVQLDEITSSILDTKFVGTSKEIEKEDVE